MPRFDRAYSLIVGPGGGSGIEVADNLRLTFEISKNDSKNPNRSRIAIYNLKPENRSALERPGTRCVLKVGYHEEGGPLEAFQGDVVLAYSRYVGPDVETVLELGEGSKVLRDTHVSLSYPKGVTSGRVLKDLAGKLGVPLTMPDDVPERRWENGLSFHGPARVALDKVAHGAELAWSIQNGAVQIVRAGGSTNRTVVELAADSGLVGAPERERKDAQEADETVDVGEGKKKRRKRVQSATVEQDGWRVRSLILPSVVPFDRVKLSSRTASGVFVVSELRHIGDTHGSEWITELKLVDPEAAATDRRASRPPGKTKVRQTPAQPLPLPPPEAPPAPTPSPVPPPGGGPVIDVPNPPSNALGTFTLGQSALA
jgi:hypothetical protein